MNSKAMSLKGRIKNYAKQNNIAAQVVMQNFMFERFLARLSASPYREKFIIKGGMLVAAIVGLDTRSTMDLDATLRNLPLTEGQIRRALEDICAIPMRDEITFQLLSIDPIRKDDPYGGFCARLDAAYETIITPLSIDLSTGDAITPQAVLYEFCSIFDDDLRIEVWGYNIETVLAEKVETILRRGRFNTRPRDYYDTFILATTQPFDGDTFCAAIRATAEYRGSMTALENAANVLQAISQSKDLQNQWHKYQRDFSYAQGIRYEDIMAVLNELIQRL